ncbi:KR-domain-containing protein [Aspergillus sclerotiicarbonarius CBS 121057]|uniref:KR-domain-containing protein n=1 Tax=Aspergillus sclerotiicarbonarius (strain CBS 121057 / IBT 28362) TaxID=1448318 RepID=A0A319EJL3_ASPSB|nr:KR-domain-containing protein [Aspergillus sclerotiicarbonarius CBS 121057]
MHATQFVDDTLRHVRSLPQPGGYLVLMEATNTHDTVLNDIWGMLLPESGYVYRNHPTVIGRLMEELKALLFVKKPGPPQPGTQFSRGEFEAAFRYLQTGRHMGKAVINRQEMAEISVVPRHRGMLSTRMPAIREAKHSSCCPAPGRIPRGDPSGQGSGGRGVTVVTPRCDISHVESLAAILDECRQSTPPVKGVVQATMVLQDRLFHNMSREEWQAVLDPKVTETWNLHHQLPARMDLFVILSSLGGMIGSRGQSQYKAAATFQDAFARHR